jgi:predicted lactoylglutathione lyase
VPRDGFGSILVGDHEKVAHPGRSECLLTLSAGSGSEVDELVNRAERAGARVTASPARRPWGYVATFADPDGHLWSVIHDSAWR